MHQQNTFSPLEVILTVIILSVTFASLLSVVLFLNKQSQYPALQHHAYEIAQNYLTEVLAQPAADPNQPETGSIEPNERYPFDDVQDYKVLRHVPVDMSKAQSPALAQQYRLTMTVKRKLIAGQPMWEVEAMVTHQRYPFIQAILSVYRNVM